MDRVPEPMKPYWKRKSILVVDESAGKAWGKAAEGKGRCCGRSFLGRGMMRRGMDKPAFPLAEFESVAARV